MSYDIRMAKITSGEVIIGKYDAKKKCFNEVAGIQVTASKEGKQMLILPYAYPFEQVFCATIEEKHIIYVFTKTPEELQKKYIEILTNISMQKTNKESGIVTG